jgi:serine/threonine protein kinase
MSLELRLRIARDIAVTFDFMHAIGIVHRDLKSHNILIDDHMNIKVCDFGLAKFKADLNKGSMQYSGTPTYMAPELF